MTVRIKGFIELKDLISFQFECRHCAAVLTLALPEIKTIARQCVNCNNDLIPYDSKIVEHIRDLQRSMRLIQEHSDQSRMGFLFRLGIKEDALKAILK
jgi:hypothetical protein